jgi:hypothetical protein
MSNIDATLSYLHSYFSYEDNNGHEADNEAMLIKVGVLMWIIEDMLEDVKNV